MLKKCCTCKQKKEEREFSKHRSTRDGLQPACKDCYRKHTLAWRQRTRAKNLLRERRLREPLKTKARIVLATALAAGRISKQDCYICGATETDAHHLLYEFPLTVIWLCRSHHSQVHQTTKHNVK